MKIGIHSKAKFYNTFDLWELGTYYAEPMYNYFVEGFGPGGFFTSLLANDALGALGNSHPANSILHLKKLAGWISNTRLHGIAYGSYEVVDRWLHLAEDMRRKHLVDVDLIYDEKDEIMLILKGKKAHIPYLDIYAE